MRYHIAIFPLSILQIGVRLSAPDGKPFGSAVIDFDLGPRFDSIKAEIAKDNRMTAVSAAGDYLLESALRADTGGGVSGSARIQEDFPEFDRLLTDAGSGSGVWRERQGMRCGVGWHAVRMAGGPGITILVVAPYAALNRGLSAVSRSALAAGAIAVLLALLLAVAIARSLSSPLTQMTRAVQGLSRGEPVELPSNGGREIAILAAAFAEMSTQIDTKQKSQPRAHQALVDSEQMAQAIIRTALDAFVQTDETGVVLDWSPHAEALTGWRRAEALGANVVDLVSPQSLRAAHRRRINRFLIEASSGISGTRYETPLLHKDGHEFLVEISLTALRRGGGWIINSFVRDITQKRMAEEQLIQAQKMESVGQLTGGIAHDFNNMLTVITGTIEILADAVKENQGLLTIAKLISDAADRAAKLTANLLAFARKQPLRPMDIDVNALINEVVELPSPTLGRQINIQTNLSDHLWPALVDPTQLSSSLVNLAINARDAMPSGGDLTFSTSNINLGEQEAAASGVSAGDYVAIEVVDTGVGISNTIRDRIFDPFFSTKQVGTGTGLGLSMVFGFAKQSGGNIEAHSEEGNGASFRIPAQGPFRAPAGTVGGHRAATWRVRDDSVRRGRQRGASLRHRPAQGPGVQGNVGLERSRGAGDRRSRNRFRSSVHRYRHARKSQRQATGRKACRTTAVPQGAFHLRKHLWGDPLAKLSGTQHPASEQALSERGACAHVTPLPRSGARPHGRPDTTTLLRVAGSRAIPAGESTEEAVSIAGGCLCPRPDEPNGRLALRQRVEIERVGRGRGSVEQDIIRLAGVRLVRGKTIECDRCVA
jgi:PAS domain S-box-containing protein